MTNILELTGVTKRFGSVVAVDNMDLTVREGEVCGCLGPNGAGKSTTIRMILAILRPDAGTVSVLGRDPIDAKDLIGYLPEERGLYRKMKVGAFMAYMGRLKGLSAAEARRRAATALERLDLRGIMARNCSDLSKGQQQKVQFVSTLLHEPRILILDEPFSGLDPVNRRLFEGEVRTLRERGTTILFSTHQMEHAERLCDRVILINKGRKILDATVDGALRSYERQSLDVELSSAGGAGSGAGATASAAASAAVSAIAGVASVTVSEDGRSLQVDLVPGSDRRATMQAILATVDARAVRHSRVALDDVFVHLVTSGADAPLQGASHVR